MRAFLLALPLSILSLFPSSGNAGDRTFLVAAADSEKHQSTTPNSETYRGYFLDLSAIAGRKNYAVMENALRHQIDIVEDARLSPPMLKFFHTIPISVNEVACLNHTDTNDVKDTDDPKAFLHPACYGQEPYEGWQSRNHGSVWDSEKSQWTNPDPVALAEDTGRGVIMVRPIMLAGSAMSYAQEPVMLHELLHAYHANILPQGFNNPAVLLHYKIAKDKKLYSAEAYLMSNEREFFAVTASVFLNGSAAGEPGTRAKLKQQQPDYYKYLVYLFGFDPDVPRATPVASAN